MQTSVTKWIEATANRLPDKTVFTDTASSITFSEVYRLSRAAATRLAGITNPREPVVVMSGRHVMTPVAYLAVLFSGCFYAPIDAQMPEHRLKQILGVINSKVILVDADHREEAEKLGFSGDIIVLEEAVNTPVDCLLLNRISAQMTANDPMYVIFTSGSTGIPKGVITSTASLTNYIEGVSEVMGITEDDVFGSQSPLDYIAAIRDMYIPYLTGASTVLIPKNLFMIPSELFDFIINHNITTLCWTVSALTLPVSLGAFEHSTPKCVNKVCFSGAVMPPAQLRAWQDNLPDALFVNQYGPTETTASCTYYIVDHLVSEDESLPIGIPYPNYRVYVANDDGSPAQSGELGEIYIGGAGLALGYYNDPERTASSFIQNPTNNSYRELIYKSGDIGLIREDGVLEFHGRRDRQIKHLGHRVELDEIDCTACSLNGITESCSLYCNKTEQIYLFYTGDCEKKEIAIKLRSELPAFMVPRKIIKLDEFPRLTNGKTDMRTLNNMMEEK